ncbi:MAG: hypothetical protein L6R41_003568 [Letrouitia leprolyta]|nr:MAG: hypothetical protein L6R41_003568 [Letrouitia leprolyta]
MSARYIPPHRRDGHQSTSSSAEPRNKRNPLDGYTTSEIAARFNLSSKPGTLNASDDDPGKLAFVLIFKDQHPDWETEGKLFCKTNLQLLSSTLASARPNDTAAPSATATEAHIVLKADPQSIIASSTSPSKASEGLIPVFTQRVNSHSYTYKPKQQDPFTFTGYYKLCSLTHLPPRGPALITLLDRKFSLLGKKRTPESWNASLSLEWGIVSFKRADADGESGNPMVVSTDGGKGKGEEGQEDGEGDGKEQ